MKGPHTLERDTPERDLERFTAGARQFLKEAAYQNGLTEQELLKRKDYAVPLNTDGVRHSGDAGILRVEIPGSVDLTRSGLGIRSTHLPNWTTVQGDMSVAAEQIDALPHGQSLDIDGTLRIVVSGPVTDETRKKILERVECLPGLSFGEIRVEEGAERHSEKSRIEKEPPEQSETREEYNERLAGMSREEFAQYLAKNLTEYSNRTDRRRLKHANSINAETIYNLLTLRPELRGMSEKEIKAYCALGAEDAKRLLGTSGQPGMLAQVKGIEKNPVSSTVRFSEGDGIYDAWFHWHFRDDKRKGDSRHKAYITIQDPVRQLTPEAIHAVVRAIDAAGFNGQMKVPDNLASFQQRFDNFVIHGNDVESIQRAVRAVILELSLHGVKISEIGTGIDQRGTSHTKILAEEVADKINPGRPKSKK